jgi:hypothetical protein
MSVTLFVISLGLSMGGAPGLNSGEEARPTTSYCGAENHEAVLSLGGTKVRPGSLSFSPSTPNYCELKKNLILTFVHNLHLAKTDVHL